MLRLTTYKRVCTRKSYFLLGLHHTFTSRCLVVFAKTKQTFKKYFTGCELGCFSHIWKILKVNLSEVFTPTKNLPVEKIGSPKFGNLETTCDT